MNALTQKFDAILHVIEAIKTVDGLQNSTIHAELQQLLIKEAKSIAGLESKSKLTPLITGLPQSLVRKGYNPHEDGTVEQYLAKHGEVK